MEKVVAVGNHLLSPAAIVVTEVNEVQLGVGKVDSLGGDVQGQTVGPVDLGGDDGLSAGAVHADPLNPGILSPVCPEQPLGVRTGVKSQSSGLGNVLVDKDHSVGTVLLGNLNGVESGVQPVDVLGDPIISQTLHQVNTAVEQNLGPLVLVPLHVHDLLGGHV